MRPIKFRAWDRKRGRMISSRRNLLTFDGEIMPDGRAEYRREDYVVMQFTGLVDKSGKEIYEGDLLLLRDEHTDQVLDDGTGPREISNHIAPVEFQGGAFGVNVLETADIYSRGFYSFDTMNFQIGDQTKDLEIVGNVYENKELLNGGITNEKETKEP